MTAPIVPDIVREALEATFEQRPGFLTLVAAAVRAIDPVTPLPAAPVKGWQPIETAPKEKVFGYGENNYGPYLLLTDGHEVVRGRWWFHNDGAENFIRDGGIAFHASHYMPLPPPPVGEKE